MISCPYLPINVNMYKVPWTNLAALFRGKEVAMFSDVFPSVPGHVTLYYMLQITDPSSTAQTAIQTHSSSPVIFISKPRRAVESRGGEGTGRS